MALEAPGGKTNPVTSTIMNAIRFIDSSFSVCPL